MKKLNFIAPINKVSYGYSGFNILKQLVSTVDVAYFPINPNLELDNNFETTWIEKIYQTGQLTGGYKDAPGIRLWHQHSLDMFPHCSKRIGFPIFELDDFIQQEKNHINNCDELIVCSNWAKEVILNTTDQKNVHVIPLGVDLNVFRPIQQIQSLGGPTIFLTVGKLEIRKLSDILPSIFEKAFTKNDNVELWVAFDNVFLQPDEKAKWIDFYKSSPLGDKIKIIPRLESHRDIANLINKCDFMVQLSRAEGFNLPAVEGLACGKYILAVNYSASTEFLNKDNSFLVEIDDKEIAFDGMFFQNNVGKWASFEENQIEQAVNHLRNMHKMKRERQDLLNKPGLETIKNFTWTKTAEKIIKLL